MIRKTLKMRGAHAVHVSFNDIQSSAVVCVGARFRFMRGTPVQDAGRSKMRV
jgi:hypothetical protein